MTQYLINRRENAAIRPGSLSLELDLSVPDEIFYHPVIVELSTCIADLTLVDNDILSYNREQATGNDGHNLLTCVMHELRCDVNSAMEWAAQYHARVESKFIEGLKNLPSWGAEVDTQVTEYLTRSPIGPVPITVGVSSLIATSAIRVWRCKELAGWHFCRRFSVTSATAGNKSSCRWSSEAREYDRGLYMAEDLTS